MKATVRVVPAEAFGEAAAAAVLEATTGLAAPVIGLPTGNTPGPMYDALRARAAYGSLDISAWRPVAIDEYGGPRLHPCSNRAYFERHWDTIPGAPPVLQFDPEAPDVDADCRRMASSVKAMGGLDLAILGIGLNGHLAFNEPGSELESTARRMLLHRWSIESARTCWGVDTPTEGVTLGLRELLGAGFVLVLANGTAKAEIVQRAIEGPVSREVPASLARTVPRHLFLLDEAASARLAIG